MLECKSVLQDCNVYGVQVPGREDGRAGMAAVILKSWGEEFTFKYTKTAVQKEGFNPSTISVPLYFYDEQKGYIPLTPQVYQEIIAGRAKLYAVIFFSFSPLPSPRRKNCSKPF